MTTPAKIPVYLDCHATTPVDPRVLEAMLPFFCERFGNAASPHPLGWDADAAVESARTEVASLLRARPQEIVFTSGATESINLALFGVAEQYADKGDHFVTVATEHKAVLDSARELAARGKRVTVLPVDSDGLVDLDAVAKALDDRTLCLSVMHANNEIGTVQPIAELGRLARERGVLFHVDAAQSAGKLPIDVDAMNIDLLSISAHKCYGPKGTGALFVRRTTPRVRLLPRGFGGGQEGGYRPGTLNVPGIVGLGAACRIAEATLEEEAARCAMLRDRLEAGLLALGGVRVNGHRTQRLPNNLHVSFSGVESMALTLALGELAVSSGSACSSGQASHVLAALGIAEPFARASVRFGLGRFTTEGDIAFALDRMGNAVQRLRSMGGVGANATQASSVTR